MLLKLHARPELTVNESTGAACSDSPYNDKASSYISIIWATGVAKYPSDSALSKTNELGNDSSSPDRGERSVWNNSTHQKCV